MLVRFVITWLCAVLFLSASIAQKANQLMQKNEKLPRFQQHIVKDRETPSSIAADFNIKTRYFLMLNNFPDSVKLKPGQKVLIRQLNDGESAEKEGEYYVTKPAVTSPPDEEKPVVKKTTAAKTEKPANSKAEPPAKTESNPLVGPNGAKYTLSGGGFHVVQKGQTFYRIALIYHLTVDELKALNNMTTTDIKVGQELKVTK